MKAPGGDCGGAEGGDSLKQLIHRVVATVAQPPGGRVAAEDVSTCLGFVAQFPDVEHLVERVIPKLQAESGGGRAVSEAQLERFLLECAQADRFPADDSDVLLEAFRTLDPLGRGYIEGRQLRSLMRAGGAGLTDMELADFLEAARDRKKPIAGRIYYEDYVASSAALLQKHLDAFPQLRAKKDKQSLESTTDREPAG
eukprot:GHVT01081647.1.p2 GENE.GHVT01081647.1~~GHVT01081647.1.p2  ORF type:complete len:198 (+),score=48.75 GHVT01081647.1:505-1098(+)